MAYTTINKSSLFMNTKLYTGNGNANNAITGVGFQPDWVWIKKRSGADAHYIFDAIRGVDKQIQSNSTAAEYNYSGDTHRTLTAFGSDGFTLQTSDGVNHNNQTFASWNWKAGTSVSGNTTGSGTAKAYSGSVNTGAGFSIIKYVGNGSAGHTIPHHLGVTPEIIITKRLSDAGEWYVYSPVMGNTKHMRLNQTGAEDTANTIWNNTSPTSSVFTVGTNGDVNGNNNPIIAYSFNSVQGYSKFGSYVGNGNADGSYVHLGFKPAFIMIKVTSTTSNWGMFDNKRLGFNPKNEFVRANETTSESSDYDGIDFLSNGFKLRTTSTLVNAAQTYLYMAFGQSLVGTNNVPATAR